MSISNKTTVGVIRRFVGTDGKFHAASEWTLAQDIQMKSGVNLMDYTHNLYNKLTEFNENKVIETDTNSGDRVTTTFNDDGSLSIVLENIITKEIISNKTVVFNPDGSITEHYEMS